MKILVALLIVLLKGCCCIELYKTNRCPNEYKESEWKEAGERLGCYDTKLPNQQTLVYYCLYDISVDEIYEFCAESFVVSPQLCPIYNFFTNPPFIGFYNCSGEWSCPSEQYRSEDWYQYQICFTMDLTDIALELKKDINTLSDSNKFSPRIICMADIHPEHKKPNVTTTTSKTFNTMRTCYINICTTLVVILALLFCCIWMITPDHYYNILEDLRER